MGKLLALALDLGFELRALGTQALQLNIERVTHSVAQLLQLNIERVGHAFCAFSIACFAAMRAITSSSCLSASSLVLAVNVPGAPDSERLM